MITRRKFFKVPLCPSCTNYLCVKLQDDQVITKCQAYSAICLTPNNLATDCNGYNDKLKDTYWAEFNKVTTEIPIIGQKKIAKAGFTVKEKE